MCTCLRGKFKFYFIFQSSQKMALSLHKISLLYIIGNLNRYSPNVLAYLPAKVRRDLLMNVPVADLWWLEMSRITAGLDMNLVWRVILSTRMDSSIFMDIWKEKIHKLQPVYSMGTQPTPKEMYMEILSYAIMNKDTPYVQKLLTEGYSDISHLFLDLVFGVRHCVKITDWKEFLELNPHWRKYFKTSTKDNIATLQRYSFQTIYSRKMSDAKLLSLLLDDCGHAPKQISIYVSEFTKSSLWKEKDFPNALNILQKWVSNAESLTFSAIEHMDSICVGDSSTQVYPSALRFITTEILASPHPNLQAVQIQAVDTKTLARLISTITPLFAKLSSPFAKPPINHVPYNYLKEIKFLSLEKHHPADVTSESLLCECISDIIRYQQHLENVFFTGLNLAGPPSTLQRLPVSLIDFVHNINWKYLHFSDSLFSFSLFQSVMETYLHSPSRDRKSLSLSGVKISEPNRQIINTTYIKMADTNIEHKQIVVRETFLPLYVVRWLFSPLHHFRLHSLELDAVSVLPNMNLLTVLARHSELIVQVLCLKRIAIALSADTVTDFQLLFSRIGLRALIIKECHIGETGVLGAIVNALSTMRFWPGKTLVYLNLEQNQLGQMQNFTNFHELFVALFQLQGFENLGLDISTNMLGPHHFATIYNMWRLHSNGKKLRQLKCDGNQVSVYQQEFISQVAQQVCST